MSDYMCAMVRSYGEARASKDNDVNHERYYALTTAINELEEKAAKWDLVERMHEMEWHVGLSYQQLAIDPHSGQYTTDFGNWFNTPEEALRHGLEKKHG